jgi:hypothetical protein
MARKLINLIYREIAQARGATEADSERLPALAEAIGAAPHPREREIVAYLRGSPNHHAIGKVVRDGLDPASDVFLYPGGNTDGVYLWPMELAYYVEKYHVRPPEPFVRRMESLDWTPPRADSLHLDELR